MNRKPRLYVRSASLLFAGALSAFATVVAGDAAGELAPRGELAPLFASTSTLELELETDLRKLRSTRREPGFQPGLLRWRIGGASGEVAVGVSPRGRFRRQRENCRFPPLFIEFPANTEGLFAGQDLLPVATHCQASHEQYVVQEYLAYRTYALLTDYSVAARLARTRYVDSSRGGRTLDTYSFLMEHFESMAARLGAVVLADAPLEPDAFEPRATALVEVFEYLIGNTDWSTVAQHNVAVLRTAAGEIVPVPYDFDFAGVIDAKYAVPSEKLDIRSVRQRLFRGFCRPEEVVRGAIDIVEDRRSAINELYRKTAELDAALVERSLAYYDKFFEIVGSPEALRREFLEPCRGDHGAGGAATRGMIAPPHDTPVVLTPGASRVNSQRRIGCA